MSTGLTCEHCKATTTNGLALCDSCQQTLRVALVNVAAFHTDVLRIQPGQRIKVRGAYESTPPPATKVTFDPVTIVTGHVDAIVVGWVRYLQDDRPQVSEPPADVARACGWLEAHITTISTLFWCGDMVTEMLDCEERLQRVLDRSDTGWHAGICGNEIGRTVESDGEVKIVTCPRHLYGVQSSSWVRCPECGRTFSAEDRRKVMLQEAREHVAPVRVVARAVVGLLDTETSVERLTRRIERWIDRKKLTDLGVRVLDGKPRRVYSVGDVFDLVTKEKREKPAA